MAILAVNAGSSTLKFSVYPRLNDQVQACALKGSIQGLEPGGTPQMQWASQNGPTRHSAIAGAGDRFERALSALRDLLAQESGLPSIDAVAHRVVHGGLEFRHSVVVSDEILEKLSQLCPLAPLHQPHNLLGIRTMRGAFGAVEHIACFDTAFHATLPEVEYTFALPQSLSDQGIRRFGFHGLSYQFIMDSLPQHSARSGGRVLMAHLGNGASLCAARDGKSCATTMGFSTLDGLMMGTRSGTLDPGVLLYLMEQGWTLERLQTLLYQHSGLLGVSGISADMRRLRAENTPAAQKAIALFTRRVVRECGSLTACLGGLDVLVFSGGIGEHDAVLRAQVCAQLAHLGVQIDPVRNTLAVGERVMAVHQSTSVVEVWVVPTDEGYVAARDAARLTARSLPCIQGEAADEVRQSRRP